MTNIDYSQQLLGFVVREAGIAQSEWLAFASSSPAFRKTPSKMGTNPFTRQPLEFRNANYFYVEDGSIVGLVAWEEAECIGVAGDAATLSPLVSLLCEMFQAKFEPIHS